MTLEDWVGEHVLTAADGPAGVPGVFRFTLDGRHLEVVEDEDDGYRSSMREIREATGGSPNVFPPCRVVGSMRTLGRYSGADEVLELRCVATGKVVIEAGTEDVDDYYPGFVARFDPEAMAAGATPEGGTPK